MESRLAAEAAKAVSGAELSAGGGRAVTARENKCQCGHAVEMPQESVQYVPAGARAAWTGADRDAATRRLIKSQIMQTDELVRMLKSSQEDNRIVRDELAAYRAEAKRLELQHREAAMLVAVQERELSTCKKRVCELEEELRKKSAELNRTSNKLASTTMMKRQMEDSFAQSQAQLREFADLTEKNKKLTTTIAQLRAQISGERIIARRASTAAARAAKAAQPPPAAAAAPQGASEDPAPAAAVSRAAPASGKRKRASAAEPKKPESAAKKAKGKKTKSRPSTGDGGGGGDGGARAEAPREAAAGDGGDAADDHMDFELDLGDAIVVQTPPSLPAEGKEDAVPQLSLLHGSVYHEHEAPHVPSWPAPTQTVDAIGKPQAGAGAACSSGTLTFALAVKRALSDLSHTADAGEREAVLARTRDEVADAVDATLATGRTIPWALLSASFLGAVRGCAETSSDGQRLSPTCVERLRGVTDLLLGLAVIEAACSASLERLSSGALPSLLLDTFTDAIEAQCVSKPGAEADEAALATSLAMACRSIGRGLRVTSFLCAVMRRRAVVPVHMVVAVALVDGGLVRGAAACESEVLGASLTVALRFARRAPEAASVGEASAQKWRLLVELLGLPECEEESDLARARDAVAVDALQALCEHGVSPSRQASVTSALELLALTDWAWAHNWLLAGKAWSSLQGNADYPGALSRLIVAVGA
jgi:hypothetical protein